MIRRSRLKKYSDRSYNCYHGAECSIPYKEIENFETNSSDDDFDYTLINIQHDKDMFTLKMFNQKGVLKVKKLRRKDSNNV